MILTLGETGEARNLYLIHVGFHVRLDELPVCAAVRVQYFFRNVRDLAPKYFADTHTLDRACMLERQQNKHITSFSKKVVDECCVVIWRCCIAAKTSFFD